MKQQLKTAFWMTIVTTILFGLVYPFVVAALAQAFFPRKAGGELICEGGVIIGSNLIGQEFSSPGYFHSRPSNGNYDGLNSGGSNLGPTNHLLISRVDHAARDLRLQNPGRSVPVDLVTASGSGLDPDISPAAAQFQVSRVARERGMTEAAVRALVKKDTKGRQFGIFGEPRVNVLELNLELDSVKPMPPQSDITDPRERESLGGSKR
ncbi:MAG TPA: potassium-transporting ATPase subunit KdpC [Candidatus Acidoferrum sp.]|nr:potassium-transporting ATPase subunit KdpC [Candidatus Acidoferrum sp.]